MSEVAAMPQSALHDPGMNPSPARLKKKAIVQSFHIPAEDSQLSSAQPEPTASPPPKKVAIDATKVMKRRSKGRLRKFDVLGDFGDFETELQTTLPPPPPPPPPPNKHTYNIEMLPPDVREAVMIAPDGGTALIEVFETIKAERDAVTEKMNTMTMARMGQIPGSDAFGTQTMSNRYPSNHPTGQIMEAGKLRALKKWEKQQKVWETQEAKLAETLGKRPQTLAMSEQRLQEHRDKMEMIDRFHRAVPLDQRGLGEKQWYLSLRDGWTRHVQVGNIFSGLFTEVVEKPAPLNRDMIEHVKRLDIDRPGTPSAAMSTKAKLETLRDRSLTARGRAWADGDYLKYRTWLYRGNMKQLAPVLPEHDALVVKGSGMENMMMDKVKDEIDLEMVESRLRIANPDAYKALQAAREAEERRIQAEEDERRAALMALAQAEKELARDGPAIVVSEQRLVLVAEAGEVGRAALRVENNGSCALYYTWSGAMQQLPAHARGGKAYDEEKFYLSDQSGVLIPGEVKHFIFTFKSDEPGIFQASWSVETHPKLEELVEPVVLRGISTTRDTKQLPRRLLHADMVGRVKEQEVSVAMERIVRGIATPPRKAGQEMATEQQAQMNLFLAQNMVLDGPVMYYHAETYAGMSELYKEAHLMLHPVLSEEEIAALEKAKAKDKTEEQPDPFESEEWNGSVEHLGAILLAAATSLDAKAEEEGADPEAIAAQKSCVAQMQSRCEELIESTKVPSSRKDIVASVLREAAYRMAFAVVDQYAEAREEAAAREDERIDEERAEEEEAGRKPPPKKEYPAGEEPYDADDLMEILEEYALPETTKAARKFGKSVRRRAGDIAAHLDGKIEEACAQEDTTDLAWHKFSLLRTRKGLLLPGGPEKRQQIGEPAEAESEDEDEEAEGDGNQELAEALQDGTEEAPEDE